MLAIWAGLNAAEKANVITDLLGIVITAAALGFAGYQFMRGVQQYGYEQRWRRKEYVAREYDRLTNDPKASLALQMLDWDVRRLPLLGKEADLVRVDRLKLGRALIPHTTPGRPAWGREEGAIRDCMDALLERLGTFEIMVAERLIEQADIAPYLEYSIALIGDPSSRSYPKTIRNLWLYIKAYKFVRVAHFIERFGYQISPAERDEEDLINECGNGMWSRATTVPPTPDHTGATPSDDDYEECPAIRQD